MIRPADNARVWRLAVCAGLPVLLAACSISRADVGRTMTAEAVMFDPGQSTYGDVLDSLGPPGAISTLPTGFAFLYQAVQTRERGTGIHVSRFRAAAVRGEGRFQAAVYVFDHDGALEATVVDDRDQRLGWGFSIGLTKARAANVAALSSFSSAHRWGAGLARALPRTLNAHSDPDAGDRGLEQRGTPVKVGQRSLESGYVTARNLLNQIKQGATP